MKICTLNNLMVLNSFGCYLTQKNFCEPPIRHFNPPKYQNPPMSSISAFLISSSTRFWNELCNRCVASFYNLRCFCYPVTFNQCTCFGAWLATDGPGISNVIGWVKHCIHCARTPPNIKPWNRSPLATLSTADEDIWTSFSILTIQPKSVNIKKSLELRQFFVYHPSAIAMAEEWSSGFATR